MPINTPYPSSTVGGNIGFTLGRLINHQTHVAQFTLIAASTDIIAITCNQDYILSELEKSKKTLTMPLTDDPRYRQLYLYNRAESEQSKSMFSVLFWKAVEEKGGCEVFTSAPHSAQARQAMKESIDAMNDQRF